MSQQLVATNRGRLYAGLTASATSATGADTTKGLMLKALGTYQFCGRHRPRYLLQEERSLKAKSKALM